MQNTLEKVCLNLFTQANDRVMKYQKFSYLTRMRSLPAHEYICEEPSRSQY